MNIFLPNGSVIHFDDEREATPLPFHRWFAWRPVRTWDGKFVWLRSTWRRLIQKYDHLDGGLDFWWQYADACENCRQCHREGGNFCGKCGSLSHTLTSRGGPR